MGQQQDAVFLPGLQHNEVHTTLVTLCLERLPANIRDDIKSSQRYLNLNSLGQLRPPSPSAILNEKTCSHRQERSPVKPIHVHSILQNWIVRWTIRDIFIHTTLFMKNQQNSEFPYTENFIHKNVTSGPLFLI